jgi:hypothetical protein
VGVKWAAVSGTGTVTSVGVTSTDLSVSGSPVTTSGSITLNINANAVTSAKMAVANTTRVVGCTFDGGGSTITTNSICYTRVPVAATIIGWAIEAVGASPGCTIDVLKIASGATLPTASIAASALPALTSTNNAAKSTTLTGWTTSMAADDMLAFKVTVPGAANWAAIHLYYTVN